MKRFHNTATLASIAFATLIIPLSAALAQSPLVPCDGVTCQLCHVAQLAQNVINFTIMLAIPIAALLFAYAGWLYISAQGNTGQISKAHGIFGKAALGFVLALSGYLIVNSLLVVVANPAAFASGSFFTITCVNENLRPKDKNLNELLSGNPTLGAGSVTPGSCPAGATFNASKSICEYDNGGYELPSGYVCPAGYTFNKTKGNCEDDEGNTTQPVKQTIDTQCTAEYPKYNATSGKCCKEGDPTQCQAASGGGGNYTYDPSVANQSNDVSSQLGSLLSCMSNAVSFTFTITSISDSMLSKNGGTKTWAQCRAGECQHSANSCHYGRLTGNDISYAADIRTYNLDYAQQTALQNAAAACPGGQVNPEGDHLHVSVQACGGL